MKVKEFGRQYLVMKMTNFGINRLAWKVEFNGNGLTHQPCLKKHKTWK
jgi:hypothetical protein